MLTVNTKKYEAWFNAFATRIGSFSVQTPIGTWPGLGNQPCYKGPCDLQVKTVENAVISTRLVMLSPPEWLKVGCGTVK